MNLIPADVDAPRDVIGTYRLGRLLGAGSTATVYLGMHTLLGRLAAIKVLSGELASSEVAVSRLFTEARVVNDICHPNIVDIIDFVVTDSPRRVALVMELIEGPSVRSLRGWRLPAACALDLASQLVDAVSAAHAAGVIHRDIKPDNLLLSHDPRAGEIPTLKVADFGIAKLAGTRGRTATGVMLGTPAYMAPEQVAGRPAPTAATDVYAIGEVLYELLTGARAFPQRTLHETVRAKLRGRLPSIELPANTPHRERLITLIRRCLFRRQGERPRIDEVLAVVGEALEEARDLDDLHSAETVPVGATLRPLHVTNELEWAVAITEQQLDDDVCDTRSIDEPSRDTAHPDGAPASTPSIGFAIGVLFFVAALLGALLLLGPLGT